MQELQPEIQAMIAAGKTYREIAEIFGLKDKRVIEQFMNRERRKQKRTAAGKVAHPKGCPRKDALPGDIVAEQVYEIRCLKMEASLENITTEYGIYLRQCRSIQVDGAFGLLKNDFGFHRFLTRGRKNVRTELFFLALAFDLKKFWMKRDKGRLRTHLSEISAA